MYSPLPLNETRNKATESLRTALGEGQDPWRSLAQVVGIYVLKVCQRTFSPSKGVGNSRRQEQ